MALFEEMGEMLTGGSNLGALSSFLGSDDEKTSGLLGMAGPALLGALGKRSASPAGAEALFGLANGADDSILDNLGGFLGGGDSGGVGGALLGSLLGSKRGAVESGLAQQSGMGGAIVSKLLPMLAPMVMGFLKRKIMGGGMNASSMASMLGDNTNAMRGGGLAALDIAATATDGWKKAEIPAANGHGNARSIVRIQSAMVNGGEAFGKRIMSEAGTQRIFEEQTRGTDLVLGIPVTFGMGYGIWSEETPLGPNKNTCYWGGYGGSVVFLDMDAKICVSYVMNRMEPSLAGDPRGMALIMGVYQSLMA